MLLPPRYPVPLTFTKMHFSEYTQSGKIKGAGGTINISRKKNYNIFFFICTPNGISVHVGRLNFLRKKSFFDPPYSYRYFLQPMRTPNSLLPVHAYSPILLFATHACIRYMQLDLYSYTMVYTLSNCNSQAKCIYA